MCPQGIDFLCIPTFIFSEGKNLDYYCLIAYLVVIVGQYERSLLFL